LGPQASIGFIVSLYVVWMVVECVANHLRASDLFSTRTRGWVWRGAGILLLTVGLGFLRERQVMDDAQPFTAAVVDRTTSWLLPDGVIAGFRAWCTACVDSHLPDPEVRSLVLGCLLGDRTGASQHMLRAFNYSGMGHLLAVSGLHLGLISLFISVLLAPLRLLPGGHQLGRVGCLVLMWTYVLLIGSPPSAVRAALMISMFQVAWIMRRSVHGAHNLSVAALFLLLYDPRLLYNLSFQLSFVAAAAILFWGERIPEYIGLKELHHDRWLYFKYDDPIFNRRKYRLRYGLLKVWSMLLTTLLLQASMLPLMLHYFHRVPVVGCVQTFLVLPMLGVHMSLIALCLLAHAWAGWMPWCSDVALWVARLCWRGVEGCSQWMMWVADGCRQIDLRLFGDVSWHLSLVGTLGCYALFLVLYLAWTQKRPQWWTVAAAISLWMAFG
jgi:competence protein ComEC